MNSGIALPAMHRLGGYVEFAPPDDLHPFVETVWIYARPLLGGHPIPGKGHRVIPGGGTSLCFRSVRAIDGTPHDPSLVLIGPVRTPRFFTPSPGLHLEAVRLKSEWTATLLRASSRELGDEIAPLSGNGRIGARRLLERLARTKTSTEATRLLLGAIRVALESRPLPPIPLLACRILDRIRADRSSALRFDALARSLAISERHLRRVVDAEAGIGPKRFQRIVRLNRLAFAADRLAAPDWSALATDLGYYDQSHMIHEVRCFTGRSPAELHAERRAQELA